MTTRRVAKTPQGIPTASAMERVHPRTHEWGRTREAVPRKQGKKATTGQVEQAAGKEPPGDTSLSTDEALRNAIQSFYTLMQQQYRAYQRGDCTEALHLADQVFHHFPDFYTDTLRLARLHLEPPQHPPTSSTILH